MKRFGEADKARVDWMARRIRGLAAGTGHKLVAVQNDLFGALSTGGMPQSFAQARYPVSPDAGFAGGHAWVPGRAMG